MTTPSPKPATIDERGHLRALDAQKLYEIIEAFGARAAEAMSADRPHAAEVWISAVFTIADLLGDLIFEAGPTDQLAEGFRYQGWTVEETEDGIKVRPPDEDADQC